MRKKPFDGRMIGILGEIVVYPRWFFLWLQNMQRIIDREAKEKKIEPLKIIERDRQTGFYRVTREAFRQLDPLLQFPRFRPLGLKAIDLGYQSGRARGSGRKGLIDLLEIGIPRKERHVDE